MAKHNKKGEILERIVALFHDDPIYITKKNERLLATNGTDKVEIDVLVKRIDIEYDVQFIFECKNWTEKVNKNAVVGFVEKLRDLGIGSNCGFMVSTSGYTKGAISKAKQNGIQLLDLNGLFKDKINPLLWKALSSTIYILPVIEALNSTIFYKENPYDIQLKFFLDFFWHIWKNGKLPSELGKYHICLDSFQLNIEEHTVIIVKIIGIAFFQSALAEFYQLSNHLKEFPIKMRANMQFGKQGLDIKVVDNESDLKNLMKGNQIYVTHRILSPRIRAFNSYWPLSKRAREKLAELEAKGEEITFEKVEPTGIDSLFEAPFSELLSEFHNISSPDSVRISLESVTKIIETVKPDGSNEQRFHKVYKREDKGDT